MKNLAKFLILILLGLILRITHSRAQDPSWSVDIVGGMPTMMSKNVSNGTAPFGGAGLRYSIHPLFSAQFQINMGVLAGTNDLTSQYFSTNFMQYSVRGIFNVTGLMKRSAALSRYNLYLYGGGGHIKCWKRQNGSDKDASGDNTLFYASVVGANIRYYFNEHFDFFAGADMNFTQSPVLDNNPAGDNDKYLMTYAGISIKILSNKNKKQNPDWTSIKLPYVDYETALKEKEDQLADAEARAAEAKKDAEMARAEAELAKEEAKADLEKAQAESAKVIEAIGLVQGKLDTLHGILVAGVPVQNNNISHPSHRNPQNDNNDAVPSNNKSRPAGNDHNIGSFASYSESLTPVVVANYDAPITTPKYKGPNASSSGEVKSDEAKTEEVKAIDANRKYAIVLGSYVKPENAFNAKKSLTDKGYNVDVVHFNDPKVQRIIIYTETLEDAQTRLAELREKENAEAWLLTIQ